MAYSEYKTRKALGKRYEVDPALVLDKQRMAEEYGALPEKRRLAEQKRQSDIYQANYQEALKQQGKESTMASLGNIVGLGMKAYGMSNSTIVGDTAKKAATGLFGGTAPTGAVAPSYMGAASGLGTGLTSGAGTAAAPLTYPGGVSGISYTVNPALMSEGAGTGTAAGGLAEAGTEAAGTSLFGAAGEAASSVLPYVGYHAMRKTGQNYLGGFLQDVGGKNQGGQFAQQVGRTISDSSNIEDIPFEWGKELGILQDNSLTKTISNILNPVGAALDFVSDVTGGMSWICTATKKHVYLTEEEQSKMNLLKEYAIGKHNGWWNSYLKHGTTLTEAISQQEDVEKFYNDLRVVLIEPVCSNIEKDIEKAFQIYLLVTKMLFRIYMPEFVFEEE